MKRGLWFIILMFCLTVCPMSAAAHPPKNLSTSWDSKTSVLTVKANHVVSDPSKHYVMALVVLNSKQEPIITKQYTKQTSTESFCDSVQLKGILSGETVKVRILCNIMGNKETTVTLK